MKKKRLFWFNLNIYFDSPTSFYETNSVRIVLFDSCSYCEDIGIKDNVVRVESNFVNQYFERSNTNFHFAIRICGLYENESIIAIAKKVISFD